MGELWRDLVDVLRRRPLLWVPVLVTDIFCYLLNVARGAILQAFLIHQTTQHSALGGEVVHGPVTASALESTAIFAVLLNWVVNFLRILLYTGAFIATAALLQGLMDRARKPAAGIGPALRRNWGGLLELALRALAVYAIAALLMGWLTPYLGKHGFTALLHNPWFNALLTFVVPLILAALLPRVALRVLSGHNPDEGTTAIARQFATVLVVVIGLLALFVASNSRELAHTPPGARYPLELFGSLLVALPYVLLFTGLALLARRLVRE